MEEEEEGVKYANGCEGFGCVYLVRKRGGVDNGTLYAVKVMQKSKIAKTSKTVENIMAERHVLGKIDEAPFLVRLHYSFQTKRNLYLVLDCLEGGDMYELLNKRERLTEKKSQLYIAVIILAIEHLHKMGIAYRDLKPENILLDSAGHVDVADYGLYEAFLPYEKVDRTYSFCGTKEYVAPEIIKGEGHNMAVDWWTVVILMFEMLTGATPFEVRGKENKMKLYNDSTGHMWHKKSAVCHTCHLLIVSLLTVIRTGAWSFSCLSQAPSCRSVVTLSRDYVC